MSALKSVTAIYIALASDDELLGAAQIVKRLLERADISGVPVFYSSRAALSNDAALLERGDYAAFQAMASPHEFLMREIAAEGQANRLARTLHANYQRNADASEHSRVAWEALPENFRRANIRAADHMPAKLWTLGLWKGPVLPGEIPSLDADQLKQILVQADAGRPSEQLLKLARIEHERWMIERKLEGWVWGPQRDDRKRMHPSLLPWDELKQNEAEIQKDIDQILAMLRYVAEQIK